MFIRLFFSFIVLLTIAGCATPPNYDMNAVALVAGEKSRLGQPLITAKCSFVQAQTGELVGGGMRHGLCIAFNTAFVYRSIDINDPMNGNSTIFYYPIINNIGISAPNMLGVKQFVISTNVNSNGFIFRPNEGLGYSNEKAYEFLDLLKTKNLKLINEPIFINQSNAGGDTYIFTTVNKKK